MRILSPRLQIKDVVKDYPGVRALDRVSIDFYPGEVHAIVGKNGAGKSTLVRILSGATQISSGKLLLDGEEVTFANPADAQAKGIGTVYQELSLVPGLTVAENIFLGKFPTRWGRVLIDRRKLSDRAQSILFNVGASGVEPEEKVLRLGLAKRQLVEIAKAFAGEPKVLLFDEPTSALSREETRVLFETIRNLAVKGLTIIYISHRLHELPFVADRVSVLRDGRLVGTLEIEEASPEKLAELMFGSVVRDFEKKEFHGDQKVVLEVRELTRQGVFGPISFELYRGEVLGIAGMVGSGRTELLRVLAGVDTPDTGKIYVNGKEVHEFSPTLMTRLGIGLTPENRKEEGLVLNQSIRENICLASLRKWTRGGVLLRWKEEEVARNYAAELQITARDVEQHVGTLSGGNQQKVLLAKWLAADVCVLLLDEPTRGIDVQAKYQIFGIIRELSYRGVGIIFVSSELEELFEVCNRILVMNRGRIVKVVTCEQATPELLCEWCMASE